MKVHWTETAQEHLAAIHAHIARDSPAYAARMVDRLTRRSQQIAGFPLPGRRVPEYDMDQIREVSYQQLWLLCRRTRNDLTGRPFLPEGESFDLIDTLQVVLPVEGAVVDESLRRQTVFAAP